MRLSELFSSYKGSAARQTTTQSFYMTASQVVRIDILPCGSAWWFCLVVLPGEYMVLHGGK